MPPEIARQWFIPGEGIDRHVISADIQRYLGNDATVRPGLGNGENQGIQGYWIKAYRNLTSAMISDLRQDSARWRQEQQKTGSREYAGSTTYNASSAGRTANPRDSPSITDPYGLPPRERIPPDNRISADRPPVDRMQIDPPAAPPARGYPPNDRSYPQEGRPYGAGERGYPENRGPYPPDTPMTAGYAQRPTPVSASYEQPRFAPDYLPGSGVPAGYPRQGDYMVQPPGHYDAGPGASRTANQYGPGGAYGQPPPPGRGPREPGYPQPEYNDPSYGNIPNQQYDPYGGRPTPSPFGMPNGTISGAGRPGDEDSYGRPGENGRPAHGGDRRPRRH